MYTIEKMEKFLASLNIAVVIFVALALAYSAITGRFDGISLLFSFAAIGSFVWGFILDDRLERMIDEKRRQEARVRSLELLNRNYSFSGNEVRTLRERLEARQGESNTDIFEDSEQYKV